MRNTPWTVTCHRCSAALPYRARHYLCQTCAAVPAMRPANVQAAPDRRSKVQAEAEPLEATLVERRAH